MNQSSRLSFGLIILGNSGAGKSYICNMLIGEKKFDSDFRTAAVTTETKSFKLVCEMFDLEILDIPGLIEAEQEAIDRNKKEISKAFKKSSFSIVLFVCAANTGGRVQRDDIIAFNSLNKAYDFPKESLLFMFNNVPSKRSPEYDGSLLTMLTKLIPSVNISTEKIFILENLDDRTPEAIKDARMKLFNFISTATPKQQKEYHEVNLRADQLEQLQNGIQAMVAEMQKDREAYRDEMKRIQENHRKAMQEADERYKKTLFEIKQLEIKYEQQRQAMERAELSTKMAEVAIVDAATSARSAKESAASAKTGTGTLGGAAAGAAVGSLAGPVGAVVGGLFGALVGRLRSS